MDPFEAPATFFALFSAVMTVIVATLVWFIKGVRADQDKISANQASIAQSLALMSSQQSEDRVSRMAAMPVFYRMEQNIDTMQGKLLDTIIMLAASAAKIEQLATRPLDSPAAMKEIELQAAERMRVQARDAAVAALKEDQEKNG